MFQKITVSGEYRCVITSSKNKKDTGWFDNLILNSGLDYLGSNENDGYLSTAYLGTGTSTPNEFQTALDHSVVSQLETSNRSTSNSGTPDYKTTIVYQYTFPQGAVLGNMTEVGVGKLSDKLFSRALIQDQFGVPTTLTLTAIDQLTVYYRVTIAPPLTDGVGSFILNNTTYNYTSRVLNANSFCNNSGTFETGPFSKLANGYCYASIASLLPTTTSNGALFTGTRGTAAISEFTPSDTGVYRSSTKMTFDTSQGNLSGGINAFIVTFGRPNIPAGVMYFQYLLDKPIPKTNTNTLSLTFKFIWGR